MPKGKFDTRRPGAAAPRSLEKAMEGPQAGDPAQHWFDPRRPPYAAIDTNRHTMTFQGIRISSGSDEAQGGKRSSKRQEIPALIHAGPVVTTVQAKATFIPPTDRLAFDKAVNRAAGKVRRGEAELPFTLTGAFRWVQLVRPGKGGHHGAHEVRQILSPY